MALNFEWDHDKAVQNLKKHGVSFEEAASVFGDPLSLTIPDPMHSRQEHRFIIIGESVKKHKSQMLPEYDFSSGMRGKYVKKYAKGTNLVVLSPDVAKVFVNSQSVNAALREVMKLDNIVKFHNPNV